TTAALARRAFALGAGHGRRRRRGRNGGRPLARRPIDAGRLLLGPAGRARPARSALAAPFTGALATAAARPAALAAATAAAGLVGGALLAGLPEDLADALAVGRFGLDALARLARKRGQQFGGDRFGRDLLLDVGLDVRQAHRVALAGEADRVALLAQARGAADAVDVVLGVERQVVVVDVLHAVDVQAARGHVGGDQDLELAGLEFLQQGLALLLRHVAGEHPHAVTGPLQRARHALHEHLGVDEHHGARALAA